MGGIGKMPGLKMDGFDQALIGKGVRCGCPDIYVYDFEKMIQVLTKTGEMDRMEAIEYIDYNCNAWMGDETPIIFYKVGTYDDSDD
jgi:hypothetical protein